MTYWFKPTRTHRGETTEQLQRLGIRISGFDHRRRCYTGCTASDDALEMLAQDPDWRYGPEIETENA